jgi:hypothetical protein
MTACEAALKKCNTTINSWRYHGKHGCRLVWELAGKDSANLASSPDRETGEDNLLRTRARCPLSAAFGAFGPIGFAAGALWSA